MTRGDEVAFIKLITIIASSLIPLSFGGLLISIAQIDLGEITKKMLYFAVPAQMILLLISLFLALYLIKNPSRIEKHIGYLNLFFVLSISVLAFNFLLIFFSI